MAIETNNGASTTYLGIDFGKKSMYIYSKDPQEGYEKHVNSTGRETYRKYVNAVSGKIVNAYFRDNNFGGKDFMMVFEDDGERYAVPMEIESSAFQNIARSIENIETDKKVRLAIYNSKAENGKNYFGVSLSYPDIMVDGKAKLVTWGEELPRGKKLRTGKWDFSEATDEAYRRAEKFIEQNDFNSGFDQSTDVASPAKSNTEVNNNAEETEDDDLPF